jgi:hypothetical protein
MGVPCEWNEIVGSTRHRASSFKVVQPVKHSNVFHEMQASLGTQYLASPKPRLLIKPLRMCRVKDIESFAILARMSHHGPWKSHLGTETQRASEVTLVPRQPAPKLKPSEVGDVSSLVRYLRNPQNAT